MYANTLGKSTRKVFGKFERSVARGDEFPQQRNGSDCVVHMLLGIDYICKRKKLLEIDPVNMGYYRKLIQFELLKGDKLNLLILYLSKFIINI